MKRLGGIGFIIGVLTLSVSCLFTVIGFLPISEDGLHWFAWLTSQFRFQYFVLQSLVLFCLMLYAVAIKWKDYKHYMPALIVVPFWLCNLYFIAPYYLPLERSSQAIIHSQKLRLLLSNVGFIEDYKALLTYIKLARPDIICIVEHEPKLDQLLATGQLQAHYPFRMVDLNSQMGLYSRIPIIHSKLEPADITVGPSLNTAFKLGSQSFILVLSHPVVPYSPESLWQQERHFQKWGKTWSSYSKPLLIVGDLNSTPWSPVFQELLHKTGLKDSQIGFGIQPSWAVNDIFLALPIDHVLASSHFVILNRTIGPEIGSDHRPVLVEMALTP